MPADPQQAGGFFPALVPTPDESAQQTPDLAPAAPSPLAPPTTFFPSNPPDRLTDAMGRAPMTAADRAAKIFELQTKTGLPHGYIDRNFDQVQKEASAAGFDAAKFRAESPKLASWLEQHPLNAALAQDDLVPLGKVEGVFRFAKIATRQTAGALYKGMDLGAWSLLEAMGDTLKLPGLVQWAKERNAYAGYVAETITGDYPGGPATLPRDDTMRAVYSGFSSIGQAAPTLVGGLLSGGETLPLVLMGTQTGGAAYSQAREAGLGVAPSLAFGTLQGGFEAATEKLPLHLLLGDLAAKSGLAKTLIHQALSEVPGEQVATALQDFDEWAYLHPDRPFQEYLDARPGQAMATLIATLVTTGVQGGAIHTLNRVVGGLAAEQTVKDLATTAGESAVAQRSPAKFDEYVQHAAEGGQETFYAPIDTFTEYMQSKGIDPATKATELTGNPDAYATAARGGEDLAIPAGKLAAELAADPVHQKFYETELRLAPDTFNAREAEEYKAEATKEQPAAVAPEPTRLDLVHEAVVKQLAAAGYTPEAAQTNAELLKRLVGIPAQRAGLDPLAVYAQYGLKVSREQLANLPEAAPGATLAPGEEGSAAPAGAAAPGLDVEGRPAERVAPGPGRAAPLGGVGAGAEVGGPVTVPEAYRDHFGAVLADARAGGYTGSDDSLAHTYLAAVEEAKGIARDLAPSPEDADEGLDLLKAIASSGGIGIEAEGETGMRGELEQLLESLNKQSGKIRKGARAGQSLPKSFRRSGGLPGVPGIIVRSGGRALDLVRESIQEDPRWANKYDNLSDFLTAVEEAILTEVGTMAPKGAATYDVKGILEGLLNVKEGGDWWREAPADFLHPETLDELSLDEPGTGPTSFDTSLYQDLFDMMGQDPNLPIENLAGPSLEILNPETATLNASGESAASLEAINRQAAMKARGDQFVVYDRAGARRVLIGPDAVDYQVREGETYGIEGPQGFRKLDDRGGKVPAVDTLSTGEKQPRLPGDVGAVREQEVTQPPVAELRDEFRLTAPEETQAKQTSLFQLAGLTEKNLQAWADQIQREFGPDLVWFDLHMKGDAIALDAFAVGRGAQRAGVGSRVMERLTQFADANGRRIVLSPSQPGYAKEVAKGTTSYARLVKFYQRFGFVRNAGRHKDFTIREGMYRDPTRSAKSLAPAAPVKTDTPAFKAWFGASKVVNRDGSPAVVYHGTTHDFETFDRDRGNIESDFGRGIYFSNTPEDVSENYAGVGPDLTSRITQRAEQIASATDREYNDPDVIAEARAELVGEHAGAIMPVYLRMENPAILGGANETRLTYEYEYAPLSDFQDDDIERLREQGMDDDEIRRELSDDNGYTEQKGTLLTFVEALRQVASRYDDGSVDNAIERILEGGIDGDMPLREALQVLRDDEHFGYYTDERGDLVSHEIIRQTLERSGYDGVIDATVDTKFGSQRKIGKQMQGMNAATIHYVAFEPNQIKSAIGNQGTYDRTKTSILKQVKRGVLRFGANRQMNIGLFEDADLTTFVHEAGHLGLEVFNDVVDHVLTIDEAARTPTQQQLVADRASLFKALGVENRAQLDEAAHERFTETFTQYLVKGEAPSIGLRRAFARIRSWLLAFYKSLAPHLSNLTDEVRGVFDRMVATDREIGEANMEGNVAPLFLTPEQAGMSKAEFALYRDVVADASRTAREQLETRLISELDREQTREWNERHDEIEQQVQADVYSRPAYQALAAMQRGTKPDGSPLIEGAEGPTPAKLSRRILRERYGLDRLRRLPRPYIYVAEGGMDPDHVADMFGYSSGDEMLTAVEEAGPMRQVIAHEVERRMLAEHGSLLLDGTLHERARAAVDNEYREKVIRAELRALATQRRLAAPFVRAGEQAVKNERAERDYERRYLEAEAKLRIAIAEGYKQVEIDALETELSDIKLRTRGGAATIRAALPPDALLRQVVADRVARLPVTALRPETFWSASRKASRLATEAAARQDFTTAIAAKQQELLSVKLYRAVSDARDDVEARVRAARQLTTPAAQQRLGKAGYGILEQVNAVLSRFGFTKETVSATPMREWVASLEAESVPGLGLLPDDVLDDARRQSFTKLTYEELVGVSDGLKQLAHLATLVNQLLTQQKAKEFAELRDSLVASILAKNPLRPKPLEFRPSDERWRGAEEWYASHAKLSTLLLKLDGGEDGGPMWEALHRPANAANDAETARNIKDGTSYEKLLATYYTPRERAHWGDKLYIPAIGDSLSKEARLEVLKNFGNQTSRDRMLSDPVRKWSPEQVQAIIDTLDRRDTEYVQAHWDFLDATYWAEIAAKSKRLSGLEPEKVEPLPLMTKWGELRGGYHPLVYDSRLDASAARTEAVSEAQMAVAGAYLSSTTRRGHEKMRLTHLARPIRLEMSTTFSHMSQVIHDLTHHEMLIDATRLLRDHKLAQAIQDTQGDVVYQKLGRLLQDIALGDRPRGGKPSIAEKGATWMRQRAQIAGLAYNLWTGVQQPLGLFNGMERVGMKWVAKGVGRWLRDAASMENTAHWIASKSPMMSERLGGRGLTQDLRDVRNSLGRSGGWFDKLVRTATADTVTQQGILDSYLWHIGLMQSVADVPTWLGEYEKQMASNADDEGRAVALADQAVLDSQGGAHIKDLAEVQRGGPIAKLFMTFASYSLTVLNASARAAIQTDFTSPAEVLRFAGRMSMLYVMPTLLTEIMRCGVGRAKCEDPATFIKRVGGQILTTALNGVLYVRELTAAANVALGLDVGTHGYEGTAGTRMFQTLTDGAVQIHQGKWDAGAERAAFSASGMIFKYPAAQVQRSIDGFIALTEGRTHNPMALLMGPPPKK